MTYNLSCRARAAGLKGIWRSKEWVSTCLYGAREENVRGWEVKRIKEAKRGEAYLDPTLTAKDEVKELTICAHELEFEVSGKF